MSPKGSEIVSDRLGTVEVKYSKQYIAVDYSVGWIEYKPGEATSDLLKQAEDMLQAYKYASQA